MSWNFSVLLPAAAHQQSGVVVTKTVTVSAELVFVGQEVFPVADISAGSWTTHTAGTTNFFEQLNEVAADDADYIHSNDTATTTEISLDDVIAPDAGTVSFFIRAKSE